MSNSAQVETQYDAIAGKDELIKSLRETIVNLKLQVMDSSTLKPSEVL